jgi:hypothetical protein
MAWFAQRLSVVVLVRVIVAAFEQRFDVVNLDRCALAALDAKRVVTQDPIADCLKASASYALNRHKKSPD